MIRIVDCSRRPEHCPSDYEGRNLGVRSGALVMYMSSARSLDMFEGFKDEQW